MCTLTLSTIFFLVTIGPVYNCHDYNIHAFRYIYHFTVTYHQSIFFGFVTNRFPDVRFKRHLIRALHFLFLFFHSGRPQNSAPYFFEPTRSTIILRYEKLHRRVCYSGRDDDADDDADADADDDDDDDRRSGDDMRLGYVPVLGRQVYIDRFTVQHAKRLRPGRGRVPELP